MEGGSNTEDIGRHDVRRWCLTLYVIDWRGQTSHIAPRPSTSPTESEVSSAPRFTDLSCRWIDPVWAASGNYSLLFHHSHVPLSCFSLFLLLSASQAMPSPNPRFPPTLGASQSRFSQGGGRRQWDAFCEAAVAALGDLFLNPELSRISPDEYSKVWGETWSPLVSFQSIMAKPVSR